MAPSHMNFTEKLGVHFRLPAGKTIKNHPDFRKSGWAVSYVTRLSCIFISCRNDNGITMILCCSIFFRLFQKTYLLPSLRQYTLALDISYHGVLARTLGPYIYHDLVVHRPVLTSAWGFPHSMTPFPQTK